MKRLILLLSISLFSLTGCQNQGASGNQPAATPRQQSSEITTPPKPAQAKMHFTADSLKIRWTAYKTTAKVPVSGTFKDFSYRLSTNADTPNALLDRASVSIKTASVFSGNAGRDQILRDAFFQMMMDSNLIELRTAGWDNAHGILHTVIRMNNKEIPVDFTVKQKDGSLQGDAQIDVVKQFKAGRALYNLHTMCEDKHTGKDGVSKTWPDVQLQFELYYHQDH